LQFGSVAGLSTAHVGFLWQRWRSRYPVVSEQGPLEPAFEAFPAAPGFQTVRFEALVAPLFPRYWFEGADGVDLCQVQQDRLIHNWRLRNEPYPHYEQIRARLVSDLDDFESFVRDEGLGQLAFNQSEVTYINIIDLPDERNPHATLDDILGVWSRFSGIEGDLEDVALRARYLFKREATPYGRLHVSVSPGMRRSDSKPIVQLEMTFRGKPAAEDRFAALSLLDEGRAVIVKSFDKMTTSEMHAYWGRKNE
jgi:uncharacterized protein (TIGR04255 family)